MQRSDPLLTPNAWLAHLLILAASDDDSGAHVYIDDLPPQERLAVGMLLRGLNDLHSGGCIEWSQLGLGDEDDTLDPPSLVLEYDPRDFYAARAIGKTQGEG